MIIAAGFLILYDISSFSHDLSLVFKCPFWFYHVIFLSFVIIIFVNSYMDEDGKQLVAAGETGTIVELGGGSELIITSRTNNGTLSKTLGSREFFCYYRQKPRPSATNHVALTLASRFGILLCISLSLSLFSIELS